MPYNHAAVSKAKEDLKTALGALEKALLEKTYLVGDGVRGGTKVALAAAMMAKNAII